MADFDISVFLKQNIALPETVKFAPTARIKDKAGKPVEFEIRTLTPDEDDAIREECYKWETPPGETKKARIFDSTQYMSKFAAACTAFPNLKSAELQDSYGVKEPEDLLKQLLSVSGEYTAYQMKAQQVNTGTNLNELVQEIKN